MKTFKLTVAKLDKELFDGEVLQITVPATGGQMTLLANHAPIISKLKKGKITIKKDENNTEEFELDSGALEFSDNRANVILF